MFFRTISVVLVSMYCWLPTAGLPCEDAKNERIGSWIDNLNDSETQVRLTANENLLRQSIKVIGHLNRAMSGNAPERQESIALLKLFLNANDDDVVAAAEAALHDCLSPKEFAKTCRQHATAVLARHQPGYEYDSDGNVVLLFIHIKVLSERDFRCLRFLRSLKKLYLVSTNTTDNDLVYIGRIKSLQRLNLAFTPVTGAGFAHLCELSSLVELELRNTRVDGTGLKHLKRLAGLKVISLPETRLNDEGMKGLANFSTDGLVLNLANTSLTDEGLKFIPKSVEVLFLGRTKVSDNGIDDLRTLTALKQLDISDTMITEEGIKRLRKHLPDCQISRGR